MNKSIIKKIAVVAIMLLTISLFIRYFVSHPEYWHELTKISPWTIVWVILLNVCMVGVLVLMTSVTIRMCGKRLQPMENFLLTSYSSLANFFGPLQSGPGVRAVYLKSRHQVRLRDYTLASLIALGLFASYSALFLVIGMRPWWQTVLFMLSVVAASMIAIQLFRKRDNNQSKSQFHLDSTLLASLLVLTFLQVVITVGWYYVELKAVNPAVTLSQAMSYSGAANFSLFVSITPDAVGIREGFLLFSQNIHHVSMHDIISANVIDRASYMLFLALLFFVTLSMHAKRRLMSPKSQPADALDEPVLP